MKRLEQKLEDVKIYINEGDVLLFRGKTFKSSLIGSSTETSYSHVGIASWVNGNANSKEGILECVEFKEGSLVSNLLGIRGGGGGRSINLYQIIKKYTGQIDVYRPNPIFYNGIFDDEKKEFIFSEKPFDGKAVTTIMRKMTGLPYGWKRIWWMFRHKLLLYRLFGDKKKLMTDELEDMVYPVCSTSVSYSFNKSEFDLVKNRSDEWTEPGDIAKSSGINYLFTVVI